MSPHSSTRRTQSCPPRNGSSSPEPPPVRTLTVVLAQASLDLCTMSIPLRGGYVQKLGLLSSENQTELRRMHRSLGDARPDILHQCLLTILDSPINKSGHLRILIESTNGLVVEVNPLVRVPRTFKRFAGLMAQLLQTGIIYGGRGTADTADHMHDFNNSEILLRLLNGPIWNYLPPSTYCIALSQEGTTVKVSDYVEGLQDTENLCIVVGAKAQGPDNFADGWVDDKISISNYSLSASVACAKFTDAVEEVWDIR